jgi:hypothetical protein
MATRFYLPSTGSAPSTPAYGTNWDDTGAASRLPTSTSKQSTAMTTVQDADTSTGNTDHLYRQYVSGTIAGTTISAQTIKFQIRALESNAKNDAVIAIEIRVVQSDGSPRGTVLSLTRDTTELATSIVQLNAGFFYERR